MLDHETKAKREGYRCIAGIDEAGRGPLAGPVVAAAVVLPLDIDFNGLTDSKKLSPSQRDQFFEKIQKSSLGYGIAIVGPQVIDKINILQSALLAMKQAVDNLPFIPDLLLIDGNKAIDSSLTQKPIVGGDGCSLSIAAASVLAKVTRDRIMEDYHNEFPKYEFAKHKGYGTKLHKERIRLLGPCPIHRKTFKGVKEFLPS